MFILKVAAFWLPMIGIGAVVGAIETGTSPVNAAIVFLAGCFLLALYSRLNSLRCRRDKEIDRLISGTRERKIWGR